MERNEAAERRGLAWLGLLNGLVIGAALAAGLWLPAVVTLLSVPVSRLPAVIVVAGALVVAGLCTLAGWLSGRLRHTGLSLLVWLASGVVITFVVGYRSYQLSTGFVWLIEPALRGQTIFAPNPASVYAILLSGLFILLALAVLALLQEYRLEGMLGELKPGGGLTAYGWSRLVLPALFVLAAGFVTGNIFGDRATSRVLQDTQRAIEVARTYEGDLFVLALQEGVNYAALRGVQDQLGAEYSLTPLQTDPETGLTIVTAHFENGAWINCRFIHEQLTFCDDASAPYTQGFASLISGREAACDDCVPEASEQWSRWLQERRAALGDAPRITFLRQRGAHVLMHAAAREGGAAVSCWFEGVDPVRLVNCREESP